MTSKGYELGSTIEGRLETISMSESEREAALDAMQKAFAIVDAFVWVAQKVRHFSASLGHKPTVAH